jgi:hypothetical protein
VATQWVRSSFGNQFGHSVLEYIKLNSTLSLLVVNGVQGLSIQYYCLSLNKLAYHRVGLSLFCY